LRLQPRRARRRGALEALGRAQTSGGDGRAADPSTKLGTWSISTGSPAASGGQRSGGRDLAGVDLAAGSQRAHRRGVPAAEPAPSERHEHGLDVREVLDDLEPDRPVSGHDCRVHEGVEEEPLHSRVRPRAERFPPDRDRDLHDRAASARSRRASSAAHARERRPCRGDRAPAHATRRPGPCCRRSPSRARPRAHPGRPARGRFRPLEA
jgi:hypothetical protein